jgi:Protein of unknown function (DUF2442)
VSGDGGTVDVGEYLRAPAHERLPDPGFFARAQVEEWGHGIEWPDAELGIPADARYRL